MSLPELLERLRQEGLSPSLKLRLDGDDEPSPETLELVQQHREEFIRHLAGTAGLELHGSLLLSLLRWIAQHHELRVEHSRGLTLNAIPEVAARLLSTSSWVVLDTPERDVLITGGSVPAAHAPKRLAEVN